MVDTLHPPASVIASWPKPNYVNPVEAGPALEIVVYISTILAVIAVLARLYARFFITRNAGIDDLFISVGLVLSVAVSVFVLIAKYRYYTGYHVWDVPLYIWPLERRLCWITQFVYLIAACCNRTSVLLFYRRLSVSYTRTFLIAVWVGIAFNVVYTLGYLAYLIAICRPINAYWDQYNPLWTMNHEKKWSCSSEQFSLVFHGALGCIADLYATLLPRLLVRHLVFSPRQRLALYGIFGLGYMVVAASICRTVFVYLLIDVDYDFTWALTLTWLFSVVELMVSTLAASAPALKPFFGRVFSGVISKRSDRELGQALAQTWWIKAEVRNEPEYLASNVTSTGSTLGDCSAERLWSTTVSEKTCVTSHQEEHMPC